MVVLAMIHFDHAATAAARANRRYDTQATYQGGRSLRNYCNHYNPHVNKNKLDVMPLACPIETFRNPGSAAVPDAFARARRACSWEPKGRASVREQYSSSFCVLGRKIAAT